MIKITNPAECCGCTACASICAHDAIRMVPDALGFLYPEVDTSKCVECGLCNKVCAFNDAYDTGLNLPEPEVYAARHTDTAQVMKSRSGAAFVAISDHVLAQGGVVYGAGYVDHFRVAHKRATTPEQRDEFRGSKYVQSDLSGVFRNVKEDLRNGLTVLFSGTPCQTAGLNSYVGNKLRDRLLLVDIVCHGAPGPYVWIDYLAYVEKKENDTVDIVNFRDKSELGWSAHKESFVFKNKGKRVTNDFTDIFYKHIAFRYSCGQCPYTNLKRPSDITLADFWGWEKTDANINKDNKGVSLLLINTAKGQEILNIVKGSLQLIEAKIENCMQPQLREPAKLNVRRAQFEQDFAAHGLVYCMRKEAALQFMAKLAPKSVRTWVKKVIKKITRK